MIKRTIHERINSRSWVYPGTQGRFKVMKELLDEDPNHDMQYGLNVTPYCNSKECLSGNEKSEFKSKF